ncbi:MAG: hypothetical protein RJA70_2008, partial [Pseudomonadota bacterium]
MTQPLLLRVPHDRIVTFSCRLAVIGALLLTTCAPPRPPSAEAPAGTALEATGPARPLGTGTATQTAPDERTTAAQPEPEVQQQKHAGARPAPSDIGPCRYFEEGPGLAKPPPAPSRAQAETHAAPVANINYAGFRQKQQIRIGKGGLVQSLLSADEKSLLVLSDQDGIARSFALPSGKAGPSYAYPGHEVLTRLSVAWWPTGSADILVGSDSGVELVSLDARMGPRTLSSERSWELKWDGGGTVLGSVAARIPEQTGVLTFFRAEVIADEPQLTVVGKLDCDERIDAWALSPSGQRLLVTHYPSNHVALYDLAARRQLWRVPGPAYAGAVDISPDGTLGAVGGEQVWLFPLLQPEQRGTFTKLGNNVNEVRFFPDSRALAVAAYDGKARLLSTELPASTSSPDIPAKEL